jgi:hypothetical protein
VPRQVFLRAQPDDDLIAGNTPIDVAEVTAVVLELAHRGLGAS